MVIQTSVYWFPHTTRCWWVGAKTSCNYFPVAENVTPKYLSFVEMRFSLLMALSVYKAYTRLHTYIIHFPSQIVIALNVVLFQFWKWSGPISILEREEKNCQAWFAKALQVDQEDWIQPNLNGPVLNLTDFNGIVMHMAQYFLVPLVSFPKNGSFLWLMSLVFKNYYF